MQRLVGLVAVVGATALQFGCHGTTPSMDGGTRDVPGLDSATDAAVTISALLGPDGGSLALPGLVLTVPPGALDAPQTLTVTRTNDAAPAGLVAYSPIYRFAPDGLAFARPLSVSIDFVGDTMLAGVFWTAPGGGPFARQTTTVGGTTATALVTHFSEGFVGAEVSGGDGGPPLDVSSDVATDGADDSGLSDGGTVTDAAVADGPDGFDDSPPTVDGDGGDAAADASDSDAAVPSTCPTPQLVSPTTTTTESDLTWTRSTGSTAYTCFVCAAGSYSVSSQVTAVQLSAPMQMTVWMGYHTGISPMPSNFGIATDCSAASPTCVAASDYPQLLTHTLGPGTYRIETCAGASVVIEPPAPSSSNTSCATAAPIDTSVFHENRVLDSAPRYFSFTRSLPLEPQYIYIGSDMNNGSIGVSVRTTCDDPATQVASSMISYHIPPPPTGESLVDINMLPSGNYWIVTTSIEPGLEFDIWRE